MVVDVSLTDIESVIGYYTQHNTTSLDLCSFPWVKQRLSLFSRVLGFFGGAKKSYWQEKYLFPILVEASLPHLQRFNEGKWKIYEESKLRAIFDFFSSRIDICKKSLSSQLITFLMGPTPSFFQEKARAQALCKDALCQWHREETFFEYKKRLQELLEKEPSFQKGVFKPKGLQEEKEAVPAPLTKKTKEHLDKTLEHLHVLRDECLELSFQLEKDFSRVFPLRYEAEALVLSLQELKESLFTLLLNIENQIAKLSEMHVIAEEDQAYMLLEKEGYLVDEFSLKNQSIKKSLVLCRKQIEEIHSALYHEMQRSTRAIDSVTLLPTTSVFRAHQARIIRMARDKVKKFKDSLSRGPGPGFTFASLEKDVQYLMKLAEDFFEEGVQVDTLRDRLTALMQLVQKHIEKESSHKKKMLQEVLVEMKELQSTLEISPDREAHFNRIVAILAELGISIKS